MLWKFTNVRFTVEIVRHSFDKSSHLYPFSRSHFRTDDREAILCVCVTVTQQQLELIFFCFVYGIGSIWQNPQLVLTINEQISFIYPSVAMGLLYLKGRINIHQLSKLGTLAPGTLHFFFAFLHSFSHFLEHPNTKPKSGICGIRIVYASMDHL